LDWFLPRPGKNYVNGIFFFSQNLKVWHSFIIDGRISNLDLKKASGDNTPR